MIVDGLPFLSVYAITYESIRSCPYKEVFADINPLDVYPHKKIPV
jgi:hypothetical protein